MSYRIYELIKPEILKKTEPDGYGIKTTELITLKEPDCIAIHWSYDSELEARSAIIDNKNALRFKELIVINVVSVDLGGVIS